MALDFVVDIFVGTDGAKYYGTLRNGVPSGVGTCIWPNNCHYDGEWRNGVMHGFGTYVWANGQRYDGEWKDGRREGIGIKTYVDGSMYDGFWRAGKKHGLGVFRPAIEETNSRRHSNSHGWQPAQAAGGQQQPGPGPAGGLAQNTVVADSSPDLQALERLHAQPGHPAPEAAAATRATPAPAIIAEAPFDSPPPKPLLKQQAARLTVQQPSSTQQPAEPQPQQHIPKHAKQTKQQHKGPPSPFEAAAAALNSENSVILPATPLTKGQQNWKPALVSVQSSGGHPAAGATADVTAAAPAEPQRDSLAVAAADADVPSSSPTTAGPRGTAGGTEQVPVSPGAVATAPRKLFVREYDMGQLLREYPLTAEEIKMIFGFLWPKNKVKRRMQKVLRRGPRLQKKLGEVVYKGHYSYNLMLELQLGIRYSVGRSLRPRSFEKHSLIAQLGVLRPWWSMGSVISSHGGGHSSSTGHKAPHVGCFSAFRHSHDGDEQQQEHHYQQQVHQHVQQQLEAVLAGATGGGELVEEDFREELTVFFPSSGSSTTPAHPSSDYRWKDYCPRVFRRLRAASSIDEADYMLSLAGSQALRQLNSPGKSGSMFLLSEDERFLVKTMRRSEMAVLLDMLPKYAAHMEKYPHSLITRFFGLHKVTPLHGRSVRFVVMANIFVTDLQIHRRYDIKGSTDGRTVGPEQRAKAADGDPNIIFKDLDVDMRIVLEQSAHDALMDQLKADCDLLRDVGVMDYSLLLGVHFPGRNLMTRMSLEPVQSASLDGILPHAGPLPVGAQMAPESAAMSAQGSLAESYFANSAGQQGAAGINMSMPIRATFSDDDTQQPPQQLQRLAAQQQIPPQLQQLQRLAVQQQQLALDAAGTAESPAVALSGTPTARSARQSMEQIPGQLNPRTSLTSLSEDTQLPPAAAQQYPISAGGRGPPVGQGGTAGVSAGGVSAGGVQQAHMLAAGVSSASARNWELYSGAAEQEERLTKVMGRMREMGFSEQVVKDVGELAKLKILGGKLKKRTQRKEPPSAVLLAMQQQRQEAEAPVEGQTAHGAGQPGSPNSTGHLMRHHTPVLSHLTSLRGAFTGLGVPFEEDEDLVDTPMALGVPDAKAPAAGLAPAGSVGGFQLGINMPALAVPLAALSESGSGSGSDGGTEAGKGPAGAAGLAVGMPEECVLCFGIIDILQDYSTRKVLERAVKGVTHDKYSISVAPPKLYAKRFLEFTTSKVFMSQGEFTDRRRQQAQVSSMGGVQQAAIHAGTVPSVLQQPPWALAPIATSSMVARAGIADTDEQFHDAADGVGGPGLPLATEDSFPCPPGQLGSAVAGVSPTAADEIQRSSKGMTLASPIAEPSSQLGNGPLQGHAVATPAPVDPPLLELVAAPIGLHLTSPVAGVASGAADNTGRLISAEQVSVTLLEDGAVNGLVTEIQPKNSGAIQDAIVVPALVREVVPAAKQVSAEQQQPVSESRVPGKAVGSQEQQTQRGVVAARG